MLRQEHLRQQVVAAAVAEAAATVVPVELAMVQDDKKEHALYNGFTCDN